MVGPGRLRVLGAACASAGLLSCVPPNLATSALASETAAQAFGGVACGAIRPKTEPDLMAWDPGSRADLNTQRQQGIVVVHYEARGCDVSMRVLSNCDAPGAYTYFPYDAKDSIVAHNAAELYAALPLGAARLVPSLQGSRAVRTDYQLVGVYTLKVGEVVSRSELQGQCMGATHVISKIYVGSFALSAGESRALDVKATALGVGGGAGEGADVQHLQSEGDPAACAQASKAGKESPLCSVPLRVALLALPAPACPAGSGWDGAQCVAATAPAATPAPPAATSCPDGTVWNGSQCVTTTAPGAPEANGTVVAAGRTWQVRVTDHLMNASDALSYCSHLEFDGGGWRLPTIDELEALSQTAAWRWLQGDPDAPMMYWSSSPVVGSPWHHQWFLGRSNRLEGKPDWTVNVRCVR